MAERIAIVVPVYNEEKTLGEKVLQIDQFIRGQDFPSYDIIIAANISTDNTQELARKMSSDHERIVYHFVPQKGKGAAIKSAWLAYDYDIYSFMDVDLSTDLNAFPILIEEVKKGSDLCIGSRYAEGAYTRRSQKREYISKMYRLLFGSLFDTDVLDPQCGFKAINRRVRDNIVPHIENDGFFFDTELLVRSFYNGYSIKEVPIIWTEDPDSTVNLMRDIPRFLRGLAKLKYDQMTGKIKGDHD